MMLRSDAALVATWMPIFGLHSSSKVTSSKMYFADGSAFLNCTANCVELRPPIPGAEFPPDNGPINASFTVSLAKTGTVPVATATSAPHVSSNNLFISFIGNALPCSEKLYPSRTSETVRIFANGRAQRSTSRWTGDDRLQSRQIAAALGNGLPSTRRMRTQKKTPRCNRQRGDWVAGHLRQVEGGSLRNHDSQGLIADVE